jgi:hypothetical protein
MRIDRFGNVGIGNTSPSYLLTLGNSSGTIGQIGLLPGNNSSFWLLRNNGGNFNIFQPGANLDRITINGTGDVGIGTSNPATRLEVNGSLTPLGAIIINKPQGVLNDGQRYLGFRVQGSDTWNIGINENPSGSGTDGCDLHFYSYTNLSQFIKSVLILKRDGNVIVASGNLGIGTVNPNHQLQIARGGGNSSTLAFVVSESTNDAFIGMNSRALSGDYSSLTKAGDSIIAQGQLNTGGLVLASHGQSSMRLGSQISFSNMPVHINIPYTAWNYFIYTKDAEQVLLAVPTNVLNGAGYATGNSLNYSYGTTRFYIAEARTYRFTYIFFKQNNLGIARFVLTQPSGAVSNYDMDLYAPTTSKITESFTWPVPLEAGTHQLEFRNIGKNASSGAYYLIGIDAVKISPV